MTNTIKEEPMTLAEWQATLDAARIEIDRLTRILGPALRCADLLRGLAVGQNTSWLEVVDAIRALDALRYH